MQHEREEWPEAAACLWLTSRHTEDPLPAFQGGTPEGLAGCCHPTAPQSNPGLTNPTPCDKGTFVGHGCPVAVEQLGASQAMEEKPSVADTH